MEMATGIKLGLAGAGAFLAGLLGGADALLFTLIGLAVADFATGWLKAIMLKKVESGVAWRGGVKKVFIFVVVGIATALDNLLLPGAPMLRGLAIGYYIATEGLSILENIGECGVPLPPKLKDVLQALQNKK